MASFKDLNYFYLGNSSIISAKPQLRNIRAELTKFVPTAVKIQRNPSAKKTKIRTKPLSQTEQLQFEDATTKKHNQSEPTKDDIYSKFMQEMDGFL